MRENLTRTRLKAKLVNGDALTFSDDPYDAVLLDAPCSATGIFRRHPDVLHRVRPRAIAQMAERQQAMLARAAGLLGHIGPLSLRNGVISAAFCWLGFVMTAMLVNNSFAKRDWRLMWIDGGHWLLVLVLMGAIIGGMGVK